MFIIWRTAAAASQKLPIASLTLVQKRCLICLHPNGALLASLYTSLFFSTLLSHSDLSIKRKLSLLLGAFLKTFLHNVLIAQNGDVNPRSTVASPIAHQAAPGLHGTSAVWQEVCCQCCCRSGWLRLPPERAPQILRAEAYWAHLERKTQTK